MVKFIIGGACSGETLGFTTLTGENQVLSISPSATSPAVTDAGAYVFRTAPSDALAGSIAANYAFTDLGAKTAAIIYETTDYAQGLEKTFKETFTALGGEVVIDEGFATGDKDFTAQVLKTKNKMPDVVYVVPQSPATGILVIKQLKSTNVTSALLTAEVLASDTVLADNEVFLDGLTAIEPFYDQTAAKAAAFLASYKAENADPEFPSSPPALTPTSTCWPRRSKRLATTRPKSRHISPASKTGAVLWARSALTPTATS